ncbi:MAG: hypothetical protein ABSC42_17045 [Tepidisphaeraceae bacterium]
MAWVGSVAFAAYLIVRLFQLINRYSVNLMFWDNFDYYFLLAGRWNYWQRFTAQVGPHREGFGMILSSAIAPLTRWNTRAEAFAIGAILTLALLLALWMKWRAFHRIAWYDWVVLPAFFLSSKQWEIWSNTVNSSHGALPLLFVVLYCLSWTLKRRALRDGCILAVNFLAVFTGFGFFMGIVTCCVFALTRNRIGLAIALASLALFFVHYKFNPENPNFRFFDSRVVHFHYAMAMGLSHACEFVRPPWDAICGYWLLALLTIAFAVQFRRIASGDVRSIIAASMIGFTFLFMLAAVEGRISFAGDICLNASRYIPLITPGLVGAYLSIDRLPNPWLKTIFVFIALDIAVNTSALVSPDDRHQMDDYRYNKQTWIRTYLSTGDFDRADQGHWLPIYPSPRPADFPAKIEYLRVHKLNFFDRPAPNQARPQFPAQSMIAASPASAAAARIIPTTIVTNSTVASRGTCDVCRHRTHL